jgi:hypothetical protein
MGPPQPQPRSARSRPNGLGSSVRESDAREDAGLSWAPGARAAGATVVACRGTDLLSDSQSSNMHG